MIRHTNIIRHCALAAALALPLFTTTPASAQQGGFGGLYAGLEGGFDRFKAAGNSEMAIYFGANLGYRVQERSGLVYGGQFRLGQSTGKFTTVRITPTDTITTQFDAGAQYGFDGIVGQAFGRRRGLLGFITLGYTWNNVTRRETSLLTGLTSKTSGNGGGFRFGGGGEFHLRNGLNFRATANFSDTASDAQFLGGLFMRF